MTDETPDYDPNDGIDTTWDHDPTTGEWEQVGTFDPDKENGDGTP